MKLRKLKPNPTVILPTFHAGQEKIFKERAKMNVVRCGRRFGKTKMMVTIAADGGARGLQVGLFAPERKQLEEPYRELLWILNDIIIESNKTLGYIITRGPTDERGRNLGNGQIDFWSLNDNELAGRGRGYDRIIIDEAAFTKDNQMWDTWETAISPTRATRPNCEVWVFSTPCGMQPANFFYRICCGEDKFKFKEHYAPSSENPLVSQEFLDEQKRINRPIVYEQEFLALFRNWAGEPFFEEEKMLVNGQPVDFPTQCHRVGAVVDTAVKTGKEHDGTAVMFFALMPDWFNDYKLVILDWEITQIEGAFLEVWIPSVFARLKELAEVCNPLYGSGGVYIEDAASGQILLQQLKRRPEMPARALPAALTKVGKDERAIQVNSPVWRGLVKFSRHAYTKKRAYKGHHDNHLLTQIVSFRPGDVDASKRADDLLDTFTYSIAITLGNQKGFV